MKKCLVIGAAMLDIVMQIDELPKKGEDTSTGERWRKRTHKELIENVELESDKFECKSRLNREDVVCWLKSIQ